MSSCLAQHDVWPAHSQQQQSQGAGAGTRVGGLTKKVWGANGRTVGAGGRGEEGESAGREGGEGPGGGGGVEEDW